MSDNCHWYDAGCQVKQGVEDLAGSAVQQFVQALADGCKEALGYVSSFWMKVPSPDIASGGGQSWHGSSTLTSLQGDLAPITLAVAVMTFAVALLRIAFSPERAGEGLKPILRQMLAVVTASLPAMAVTQLLIGFGDEFSPWIIKQASGQSASEGFKNVLIAGMFGTNGVPSNGLGLWLVIFLLGIIGAVVQCLFMVLRGGALIVLLVLLPPAAAASGTEEGWARYKKMLMVIVGFALYKPVAAVIYATGMKLMSQNDGDQVQNALYGLTVITMAAVALPALIKFLMPAAAVGSSSAFSGAGAVGALAAGAAVVGLASTGAGAGAAAGAASGGGKAPGADAAGGGSGGGQGTGIAGGGGGGGNSPADGADPNPVDPTGGGSGSADGAAPTEGASEPVAPETAAPAGSSSSSSTSTKETATGATSTSPAREDAAATSQSAPNGAPQRAPSGSRGPQVAVDLAKNASQQIREAGDGAAEGAEW